MGNILFTGSKTANQMLLSAAPTVKRKVSNVKRCSEELISHCLISHSTAFTNPARAIAVIILRPYRSVTTSRATILAVSFALATCPLCH